MNAKTVRWFALFGVSLLIGAVAIVLSEPSVNQYEISIYGAYPESFWMFVVGAILIGTLVILESARIPDDDSWVFGLLLVFLTNGLVLVLPYVRGYQMIGRADAMSHLGYAQDIVGLGSIESNIYPPMHLLMVAVSDATGSELVAVGLLVPLVFSILYFSGLFYLLVFLFNTREQILFSLPFVMLPILGRVHVGLRPFDLSVLLIPLVLFLFFRSQRIPTPAVRGSFIVVLVGILLYHPLTALLLIGLFALYFGVRYVPGVRNRYVAPRSFVSVSLAVFLAWYTNFTGILVRFVSVFETLAGDSGDGEAPIEGYSAAAEEASPSLIDILQVATFSYGVELILFSLGFLFFVVTLWLLVRGQYVPDTTALLFVGGVLVFSIGSVFFLLLDLIVPHDRPLQLAKISAVILVGQLFYLLWAHLDWSAIRPGIRTSLRVTAVVVIAVLISLTVLSIYPSSLSSSANNQVTEMEMTGNEWLTQHGTASDNLAEFGISYRRFYHAQHGLIPSSPFVQTAVPDHFNYTRHTYLGESYSDDSYLTLTSRARRVYPEVFPNYPENWRFTPAEFARLERDRTTDRLYDNGDYTQYLVDGTATDTSPSVDG